MDKGERSISTAVVRRLPRYYRYLGELSERGVERISSAELSRSMGVTASQIRQDLNNFGGFGHQGYGYNVDYLRKVIGEILGLTREYHVVIVGAGNLGMALANYTNFEKRGFRVQALFDVNPDLTGLSVGGHQILPMDQLTDFLRCHSIDIGVLALPKNQAQQAASLLVENGIQAIWNFASIDLVFPDQNVIVENVHLSDSLMTLSYRLEHKDQ